MDKQVVGERVIEAIGKIQSDSGRPATEILPRTRPFCDVEGFDSHSGVEATLLLSEVFEQELPDSVFIPTKGKRILSVAEIAQNIYEIVN